MSRGVLINTLDTYIGTALYEEFLGENPSESAYELYGTWHSKDESSKPAFIKKMLNVTKTKRKCPISKILNIDMVRQ